MLIQVSVLLMAFCLSDARHTPHRNYNIDWVNLIEDPDALTDARMYYTLMKDDMLKRIYKRDGKYFVS